MEKAYTVEELRQLAVTYLREEDPDATESLDRYLKYMTGLYPAEKRFTVEELRTLSDLWIAAREALGED
jgi:hypothetical protein